MLFDPDSDAHELLADFVSTPAVDTPRRWCPAIVVDEEQLFGGPPVSDWLQPIKALIAAYRRWFGLPTVRWLADDLHLVRRNPGVASATRVAPAGRPR